MLLDLAAKYSITPSKSYMIGDKSIDAECGVNAGMTGIVVRQESEKKDYPFFKTLLDFAKFLEN